MMDNVEAWQSRPLETVYPTVFFDCLVLKVRQDTLIIFIKYVVLGIDLYGQKDILGLWISLSINCPPLANKKILFLIRIKKLITLAIIILLPTSYSIQKI